MEKILKSECLAIFGIYGRDFPLQQVSVYCSEFFKKC